MADENVKFQLCCKFHTPAYATALGNLARFPEPSAYTLAPIKIILET